MQKRKQKLQLRKHLMRTRKQLARVPKQLIPYLFIAGVSIIVLLVASVQALKPGRACVDAPLSAYPSMQVITQRGDARSEKTVTNRHIISCLADDIRHLPEYPSTPVICPQSDGSTYILSFDGGPIVSGSLSGCQAVKVQGDNKIYYLLPDTAYAKDMRSKLQRITQ